MRIHKNSKDQISLCAFNSMNLLFFLWWLSFYLYFYCCFCYSFKHLTFFSSISMLHHLCFHYFQLFISSVFYIFWNLLQMSPLCLLSFWFHYKLTDSVSTFPIQILDGENIIGPIHHRGNAVGQLHGADQPWSRKSNTA